MKGSREKRRTEQGRGRACWAGKEAGRKGKARPGAALTSLEWDVQVSCGEYD